MKLRVFLCLWIGFCSACTSFKPMDQQGGSNPAIATQLTLIDPGQRVRITTQSGQVHKFRSTNADATGISGDGVRIPAEDIAKLETRQFAVGKTLAIVGGVVFFFWAVEEIDGSLSFD